MLFYLIICSKRRQARYLYCWFCGSTSLEILSCTDWLLLTKKEANNLKWGFAEPVLFNGFAGKHLCCNNIFLSRNTAYGLSVLDQRFEWFKINYKFQFKDQRQIFCSSTGNRLLSTTDSTEFHLKLYLRTNEVKISNKYHLMVYYHCILNICSCK